MERRKFVIGAGALTTGSAAAVGSGAFTNATVERDLTVATEGDDAAVVGLHPITSTDSGTDNTVLWSDDSEGDYASNEDGQLKIEFPNLNEDVDFTFEDVFVIQNNGTEVTDLDRINPTDSPYYDSNEGPHILVAEEVNGFQEDVGRYIFGAGEREIELEPGDWVSIGFGFFDGPNGVGSAVEEAEDIEELGFTLGG